jgi:hypothetical protein
MRKPIGYTLKRMKIALTVLVAIFVMAGAGVPWGALQVSVLAGPLTDEVAYEGAQGIDDPCENDDPSFLASLPAGETSLLDTPLTGSLLLSRFTSIPNSHPLLFSLRC